MVCHGYSSSFNLVGSEYDCDFYFLRFEFIMAEKVIKSELIEDSLGGKHDDSEAQVCGSDIALVITMLNSLRIGQIEVVKQIENLKLTMKQEKGEVVKQIENLKLTMKQEIGDLRRDFESERFSMEQRFQELENRVSFNNNSVENHKVEMTVLTQQSEILAHQAKNLKGRSSRLDERVEEVEEKLIKLRTDDKFMSGLGSVGERASFGEYSKVEDVVKELKEENIIFSGSEKGLHPIDFLNQLERFTREITGMEDKVQLRIVRQCLTGGPRKWYAEHSFDTYGDFRKEFVDNYWGRKDQLSLSRHIFHGRFNGGETMSLYIKNLASQAQFLTVCPIANEDMVNYLMEHLPPSIRLLMLSSGSSLKSFLTLLERIEKEGGPIIDRIYNEECVNVYPRSATVQSSGIQEGKRYTKSKPDYNQCSSGN